MEPEASSVTSQSTHHFWTRAEAGKEYDQEFQGLIGWYTNLSELQPIEDLLKAVQHQKILDVGCGTGRYLGVLNSNNQLVGLDFSVPMLEIAKEKNLQAVFTAGSAAALPFPNESFDIVLSIRVLQHIHNQKKLVEEAARVCSKNGRVILLSYNSWSLLSLYKQIRMSWIGRILNLPFGLLLGRRSFFNKWGFEYDNYCSLPELERMMRSAGVAPQLSWGVTTAMPWFLNDFFVGKILQKVCPGFFEIVLKGFLFLDRTLARHFPLKFFTDKVLVLGVKST